MFGRTDLTDKITSPVEWTETARRKSLQTEHHAGVSEASVSLTQGFTILAACTSQKRLYSGWKKIKKASWYLRPHSLRRGWHLPEGCGSREECQGPHSWKQRSRGRRLRGARRAGSWGQRWRSSWWASQGRKTELFLWNKNVRDPILKYHYRSQKLRSAKDLAGLQAARLLQPLPGCHRGGGSWRLRGEWASGTVPSATLTPDTQGRRDRDTRAEPPAREKDIQLGTRAFRSPGRERPSRGFSGAAVLPGCLLKAWKGRLKLADRATEVRPEFKSSSLWSAVWHWPSVVKSQLTNVDWGKVNVSGRMAPSGGWHRRGTTAWWALRDTEHGDSCRTWAQGLQGRRRTGTADGLL